MPLKLRLLLVGVSLLLFLILLLILRKGRMPIKYSLVWFFSSFIILLLGIIPELFEIISSLVGFITISNMIIGVFILILLIICLSLTIMISTQNKKITLLIQEISLLKEKDRR